MIGSMEEAEETHDKEEEDQEEEDVIPNFEIDNFMTMVMFMD